MLFLVSIWFCYNQHVVPIVPEMTNDVEDIIGTNQVIPLKYISSTLKKYIYLR